MNDLYQRIGVSPEATAGQIADACRTCDNRGLHDAAVHVLLDEHRRAAYDRIHRQLIRIGQLRANLGLNYSEHWQVDFEDFDCDPTLQGSLLDRMERRYGSRRYQFWQKNWRWIAGLLWITIFSCAVGYLLARNSGLTGMSGSMIPKNYPVLALPASGLLTKEVSGGDATMKLRTEPFGANCLVKLQAVGENWTPVLVFVRAGEDVSVRLPTGEYKFRFAAGTDWYGMRYLFGPRTVVMELDGALSITNIGELEIKLPELQRGRLIETADF